MNTKIIGAYEVRELTIGELFPIIDLLSTDTKAFQLELAKLSIFKDDKALGEELLKLGIRDYMQLIPAVMEVHGFIEKKD
jgi:hypothetical protein